MTAKRASRQTHPETEPTLPDAAWRQRFRRRLRRWYASNARDLPWRRSRDPYRVWVSEIMLQQTQVATVQSYFERFVEAFPSVEALAAADEEQVLRLWEGLGYYRRARQMHQAAKTIVAQHGGRFPHDPEAVHRLPGIGRYTAGAILSIALDQRVPILEANTMRLFARLLAFDGDPTTAGGSNLLWTMAEAVLPQNEVGSFNQALMELGSEVCRLRSPRCDECPVAPLCRARAEGRQHRIPPPKRKPTVIARREAAVAVLHGGRVLIVRQGDGGRWAGLWDFPRFEISQRGEPAQRREIVDQIARLTGLSIAVEEHLMTVKHGVTRYRITLECYRARCIDDEAALRVAPSETTDDSAYRWVRPAALGEYPLNTTGRQLARAVQSAQRSS
jgi:A/G-specific adenine glycosylase